MPRKYDSTNRARIRDYISAYGAALPGAAMSYLRGTAKRSYSQMSTQSLTGASLNETEKALEVVSNKSEFVERRRANAFSTRLHPAKYLVMDKMLKQLFFPLMTTKLNFGITSFTGYGLINAQSLLKGTGQAAGATDIEEAMRPRGLTRGIVQFTVRDTNYNVDRNSDNALNPSLFKVGEITSTSGVNPTPYDIDSSYRRFVTSTSATADSNAANTTSAPQLYSFATDAARNKIRSLSMGSNLNDIEQNAVSGMIYADPMVSQYRTHTETSSLPSANSGLIAGESATISGSSVGPSGSAYWSYMKDAVIRIADGYVQLDVLNTEQTPCVLEVVIHSRKKSELTTQEVFNMLWNDVERNQRQKAITDPASSTGTTAGGWQAWYDPKYPLLKYPSNARVKSHITEVHRSNHVLAPGQSKVIKIALGNLWYKIGNKSDDGYTAAAGSAPSNIDKSLVNAGQLYFTLGHSGFEYPQSVSLLEDVTQAWTAPSSSYGAASSPQFKGGNIGGTSFWVGKAHAPSSISLDGTYEDKFYPATFDRSSNGVLNHDINRIATVQSQTGNASAAVPLAVIVPNRVATSQSNIVQPIGPAEP